MKAGARGRECLILWAMHQDDASNGSDTWWVGPLAAGVWLLCNGARRRERGAADRRWAREAVEARTERVQKCFQQCCVARSDCEDDAVTAVTIRVQ